MATERPVRHIDTKDVAKLIRRDLKAAFPYTGFTVRISRYAGGSSIDVRWMDGPTTAAVEGITGKYRGKGLIDNTDYAPYLEGDLEGEGVHFGSDYMFCTRSYSRAFAQEVADEVAERYGVPWITVLASSYDGSAEWGAGTATWVCGDTLSTHIWREISRRDATVRPGTPPPEPGS